MNRHSAPNPPNRTIRINPSNPLDVIPYCLMHDPSSVVAFPVLDPSDLTRSLVIKAHMKRQRIPPELAAKIAAEHAAMNNGHDPIPTHVDVGRLLMVLPSDMVQNIKGPKENLDPIYMVTVRREVYDGLMRQANTGLILPSDPGAGGIIL